MKGAPPPGAWKRGVSFALLALLVAGAALLPGACAAAPAPPSSGRPGRPVDGASTPAPPPRGARTSPADWGPEVPPDGGPPPPPAPLPADPETVTVILSAGGPRRDVRIAFEGTGRIDGAEGRAAGAVEGHVVAVSNGALRVDGAVTQGPVRFVPDGNKGVLVGTRLYDGALEVSVDGDALVLRNILLFPLYLEGVVAGEMPASFPAEALRAQAILARSYALSRLAGGLTDDPGVSQAYPGRPPASALAALRAAVSSTRGMRLVDAVGAALPDYWYHSTCGGRTAPASTVFGVPPHPAYAGVACDGCTASKFYRWDLTVSEADLRKAVRFGSAVVALDLGPRDSDGRTITVLPRTAAGTVKPLKATDLRFALGTSRLRSTWFESVEGRPAGSRAPSEFLFRGRGWGHGVGLCQMGAGAAARRGERAETILRHYYPGSFLETGGP